MSLEGVSSDCEAELVRRARRGEASAFGSLVQIHWARLVRLSRSIVGEAEAEDAVQDGLIRAWKKLPGLRRPEAFGRWLSRLVVRVCLRRARGPGAVFVPLEAAPGRESNPEPAIEAAQLLASLPPRQRAVMHLTVVEGLSDSEIASLLGVTAGSVRAHRRRARQGLERRFSERSA